MGKVRTLKDVSVNSNTTFRPGFCFTRHIVEAFIGTRLTYGDAIKQMTTAIGDEIRDSSALAEKMNDTFDQTRLRLRGTMNRMLIMAERSGIPWKVWLAFFVAVIFIFTYVWLF